MIFIISGSHCGPARITMPWYRKVKKFQAEIFFLKSPWRLELNGNLFKKGKMKKKILNNVILNLCVLKWIELYKIA
jgi:hypothetical protein